MQSVEEYRERKTIIIGEVNTGKTAYLTEILNGFKEQGETGITVIDMAPDRVQGIGGKMNKGIVHAVRYYTCQTVAPRLVARTVDEVESLAIRNAKLIEDIFLEYQKNPGKVLFINDISLYLQAGDSGKLLSVLDSTPTVIMNGYYGSSLGGGEFGKRERQNMEALRRKCDRVIRL